MKKNVPNTSRHTRVKKKSSSSSCVSILFHQTHQWLEHDVRRGSAPKKVVVVELIRRDPLMINDATQSVREQFNVLQKIRSRIKICLLDCWILSWLPLAMQESRCYYWIVQWAQSPTPTCTPVVSCYRTCDNSSYFHRNRTNESIL